MNFSPIENGNWTHGRHERVENADSEGCSTGERLRQVELRVRIVVVVLVQKLHITVIDQLCKKRTLTFCTNTGMKASIPVIIGTFAP